MSIRQAKNQLDNEIKSIKDEILALQGVCKHKNYTHLGSPDGEHFQYRCDDCDCLWLSGPIRKTKVNHLRICSEATYGNQEVYNGWAIEQGE